MERLTCCRETPPSSGLQGPARSEPGLCRIAGKGRKDGGSEFFPKWPGCCWLGEPQKETAASCTLVLDTQSIAKALRRTAEERAFNCLYAGLPC